VRERSVISQSLERYPSTSAEWIVWHRVHFHHSIEQGAWMAEKTLLQEAGLPRSTLAPRNQRTSQGRPYACYATRQMANLLSPGRRQERHNRALSLMNGRRLAPVDSS